MHPLIEFPKLKHPAFIKILEAELPVEIGFLLLYVDRVERVESEPGGEGESSLVRPLGQWWNHDSAARLAREGEEDIWTRSVTR